MIPGTIEGRNLQNYVDVNNAPTKLVKLNLIANENIPVSNGLLEGVHYTKFTVAYPTSTREVYTFLNGATQVAQIQIDYTNASKQNILSGERL